MKLKFIIFFMLVSLVTLGCSSNDKNKMVLELESGQSSEELSKYYVDTSMKLEKGMAAPKFNLQGLDSEDVNLELYSGKYILLNFFTTWCAFCDAEMPDLEKLNTENDDLILIGVNVNEPLSTVEEYINNGGYSFRVAMDFDSELAKAYYISSYPTSIFIDPNGNLLGGVQGMMTYEDMENVFAFVKETFEANK